MPRSEDQELLLRAGKGDRGAFGLLVERHHEAVVRFCYRFLGRVGCDAAEDLAQDVFLSAFKAAPYYQPQAAVRTWLFRLATNACLNQRRKWRVRRVIGLGGSERMEDVAMDDSGADASALRNEKGASVRAAVGGLPGGQRAAIVLRHYHDFSYTEIADVLDTSVSAVESLLFRARRKLRSQLPAFEIGNSPQVSADLRAEPF